MRLAEPLGPALAVLAIAVLLSGCSQSGEAPVAGPARPYDPASVPGAAPGAQSSAGTSDSPPTPPASPAGLRQQRLEIIVLKFDQSAMVTNNKASFKVPAGTSRLSFTVFLNASGSGPYLVGPPAICGCRDAHLALRAPDKTYPWVQDFALAAGNAATSGSLQGPFDATIEVPAEGTWTLWLSGTGRNVHVDFTPVLSLRAVL